MKQEIRERVHNCFDLNDIDYHSYEDVIKKLTKELSDLKENYPKYKYFCFDVDYGGDYKYFNTVGVRDETDEEYNERLRSVQNAIEREKQQELSLLAKLKAKYES